MNDRFATHLEKNGTHRAFIKRLLDPKSKHVQAFTLNPSLAKYTQNKRVNSLLRPLHIFLNLFLVLSLKNVLWTNKFGRHISNLTPNTNVTSFGYLFPLTNNSEHGYSNCLVNISTPLKNFTLFAEIKDSLPARWTAH
jgi:hypothetical protein